MKEKLIKKFREIMPKRAWSENKVKETEQNESD